MTTAINGTGSQSQPRRTSAGPATVQRAILETLLYSDLFDYPLTLEEVLRYLNVPADREAVYRVLIQQVNGGKLVRLNG